MFGVGGALGLYGQGIDNGEVRYGDIRHNLDLIQVKNANFSFLQTTNKLILVNRIQGAHKRAHLKLLFQVAAIKDLLLTVPLLLIINLPYDDLVIQTRRNKPLSIQANNHHRNGALMGVELLNPLPLKEVPYPDLLIIRPANKRLPVLHRHQRHHRCLMSFQDIYDTLVVHVPDDNGAVPVVGPTGYVVVVLVLPVP